MRPDQPCIFFLTLPSLVPLLPQSLRCGEQAELQLQEQIMQTHSLHFPGEGIFPGHHRKTQSPKPVETYVLVVPIQV